MGGGGGVGGDGGRGIGVTVDRGLHVGEGVVTGRSTVPVKLYLSQ